MKRIFAAKAKYGTGFLKYNGTTIAKRLIFIRLNKIIIFKFFLLKQDRRSFAVNADQRSVVRADEEPKRVQ